MAHAKDTVYNKWKTNFLNDIFCIPLIRCDFLEFSLVQF